MGICCGIEWYLYGDLYRGITCWPTGNRANHKEPSGVDFLEQAMFDVV